MSELGVEPKYSDDELKDLSIKTPNVIGKSVSDAQSTLSNAGLKYKVIGSGKTVLKQSPTNNDTIPSGGKVVLYTESKDKQTTKVPDFTGLTVTEANRLASDMNLNMEIAGNDSNSALVVAFKQSEAVGTEVEIGSVITVTFKSTQAVLD
jgi:stage V sporulation protein D (sporulation-specific penicillin-binding protein)